MISFPFLTSKKLHTENAALREKIADLDAQLKEARASRLITPAEEEGIAALRKENAEAQHELRAIALFMRENFRDEIARGEHAGSLSDTICRYLARVKMNAA